MASHKSAEKRARQTETNVTAEATTDGEGRFDESSLTGKGPGAPPDDGPPTTEDPP